MSEEKKMEGKGNKWKIVGCTTLIVLAVIFVSIFVFGDLPEKPVRSESALASPAVSSSVQAFPAQSYQEINKERLTKGYEESKKLHEKALENGVIIDPSNPDFNPKEFSYSNYGSLKELVDALEAICKRAPDMRYIDKALVSSGGAKKEKRKKYTYRSIFGHDLLTEGSFKHRYQKRQIYYLIKNIHEEISITQTMAFDRSLKLRGCAVTARMLRDPELGKFYKSFNTGVYKEI